MKYPKYPSLIIQLKQILDSQNNKVEIETGNNIEHDVTSYQVKKTIVKSTNTKTATSFSFPELHANQLINQLLHVVDLNIYRYDMMIGRYLIISLGIDIHGAGMTINWDNYAIPCCSIYSTTNNVFAILQYNAPFNSEKNRMKRILNDRYSKADLKTIA